MKADDEDWNAWRKTPRECIALERSEAINRNRLFTLTSRSTDVRSTITMFRHPAFRKAAEGDQTRSTPPVRGPHRTTGAPEHRMWVAKSRRGNQAASSGATLPADVGGREGRGESQDEGTCRTGSTQQRDEPPEGEQRDKRKSPAERACKGQQYHHVVPPGSVSTYDGISFSLRCAAFRR
jgi:hypothetical protein